MAFKGEGKKKQADPDFTIGNNITLMDREGLEFSKVS